MFFREVVDSKGHSVRFSGLVNVESTPFPPARNKPNMIHTQQYLCLS